MRPVVWDWPTRLTHWGLALSVTGAWITGSEGGGWLDWHVRFATAALALLLFRLAWGLVGSHTARFASFLPTWSRWRRYWQGNWQEAGHTPLGALSVLALLGVLAAQIGSGLFAADDTGFHGPWANTTLGQSLTVSGDSWSEALTGWHHLISNAVLALVLLHVGAILFYRVVKGRRLTRSMIDGLSDDPTRAPARRVVVSPGALVLSVALAAGGSWLLWNPPQAPAPAPVVTPAW